MRAEQFVIRGSARLAPLPLPMSIFQYRHGLDDSLCPLRMARTGIINAMRIVKNDHRGCKMPLERIFDYLEC
jgi:hypothetical protein